VRNSTGARTATARVHSFSARALSEISEEVGRTHERVHITKNGKDYVVLLAAEDLESIEATLGEPGAANTGLAMPSTMTPAPSTSST
jgi:prevent-host-death family protein